jgi:hypothetical protein
MYSIILFSLLFSAMTNSLKRQVFIHEYYNGCSDDRGWFMLKDYDSTSGCTQWDAMTGRNRLLFMVKLRESFDNGMGI